MAERRISSMVGGRKRFWWILILCLGAGCVTPEKKESITYVPEKDVPNRIAVLPARFHMEKQSDFQVKPESDDGIFVTGLVRGVIQNQMAGKGYATQPLDLLDRKLTSSEGKGWETLSSEKLCQVLDVDALITPKILAASMVTAVAYNLYEIKAQIRMVNRQGRELGVWIESSSKRKIALPMSPLGAAGTLMEAALDEPARKQMRLVIYDWGWKLSQVIPECPHEKALPEVLSVESNIDKGVFASGDQIQVAVHAEKGLSCTFDIGDFKKGLVLSPDESGVYKGVYRVHEGDKISQMPLLVRLVKPNGVERLWMETGGTISIDAIAPPSPKKVTVRAGKEGVSLAWDLPQAEDLNGFVVERGDKPVGEFAALADSKELSYLDAKVTQGATYYYRIRSKDGIGNRSSPSKIAKATVPLFSEVRLGPVLKGALVPGVYVLEGPSEVPEGEVLTVVSGTKFRLGPGTLLRVKGVMEARGSPDMPVLLEGEEWLGIAVQSGARADLVGIRLKGCSPCLTDQGGVLQGKSISMEGKGGVGLAVEKESLVEMEDLQISGFQKGIVLGGGKGKIEKSSITQNQVGIEYVRGAVLLVNNNIFSNQEQEVEAAAKLVLYDNYLGASTLKEIKLKGDVVVKSLLDAPFPNGQKVILVEDKATTPEMTEARFQKLKKDGVDAFQVRRFGDAHQSLSKALSVKEDKEVYLYLAYTEMILGEEAKMEKTLQKGIEAFPYEVRLYQTYVKYLATKGKKEEAMAMLEKALKMNPEDPTLKGMKEGLMESPKAKPGEALAATPPPTTPKAPDFDGLKNQGIEAFKKRQYKEADESLTKALAIKQDRDVYLHLAYVKMSLGDNKGLEETLEKGIKAYPDEAKLYGIYARHLGARGETSRALSVVQEGLKKNPKDPNLISIKEYLEQGRK